MPLIETKGAASAQGFGGAGAGSSGPVNYIEDVFSTYLYTGNGSTQTITNGIDLSTKGGLVWFKCRSSAFDNKLFDTARSATQSITSNLATAQTTGAGTIAFGTTGFTTPNNESTSSRLNETYVSWTFRKQPKFFDVVTYTGNGATSRDISHNLGSVPGCIIVKSTSAAYNWYVYHRSTGNTQALILNLTVASAGTNAWKNTTPTSTVFTVDNTSEVNENGQTYVAYLFAHDAGGFGLTGSDNVISCGSYTGNGSTSGPTVTLGYEPQWLLVKDATGSGVGYEWYMLDTMRGWTADLDDNTLYANRSNAENTTQSAAPLIGVTSTGFKVITNGGGFNTNGNTYIYIAIRRGPMKVPTSGTSVFGLSARTGTDANATVTGSAGVSDAVLIKNRGSAVGDLFASRLTGTGYLETSSTAAEVAAGTTILQANPWDVMDGVKVGTTSTITNASANTYINYLFDRAPSFFDVVCYTGDGSASPRNISHNLAAIPELIIIKNRSFAENDAWPVFGSTVGSNQWMNLWKVNGASAYSGAGIGNTATTFQVPNGGSQWNNSPYTYVAYLFATCAGVSKVGSYTGTGALQTVNCGFTGGARFVLIKRTDTTGDWYVYDSARGISSGNDPYLLLNSTAAEVTGTNYVDTTSVGFQVTAAAPAGLNANGGSFVFLAIA